MISLPELAGGKVVIMKYKLTNESMINAAGKKLFRIKALVDIEEYGVKKGDLGGWIEKEDNLSQSGNAWIFGEAKVSGSAEVSGDADYAVIKGFGTEYRPTTFFRCRDGEARVTCGCFYGTIAEFREQVKRTREGKVANEYLKIADLMEYHFKEDGEING
jgi:hypothetical protein